MWRIKLMKQLSDYYQELTEWFYKQPVTKVLTYEEIGREMKRLRKKGSVTQTDVGHAVSMCRIEMELSKGTTIINVPKRGYKLATPAELAIHAMKSGKRTMHWADRTYRALEITDRRLIPGALKKVFPEEKIRTLSVAGKRFISNFVEYSKNERRAITNGKKKQIK
jgi:hypothetical protein